MAFTDGLLILIPDKEKTKKIKKMLPGAVSSTPSSGSNVSSTWLLPA